MWNKFNLQTVLKELCWKLQLKTGKFTVIFEILNKTYLKIQISNVG